MLHYVENKPKSTSQSHTLKPIDQLLIGLRVYARGSFLQVIGDTIGVDKSTVFSSRL